MKRIAFIGGGNVSIAILGGLIAKGMGPEQITSMQGDRFAEMIFGAWTSCRDRSIELGRAK